MKILIMGLSGSGKSTLADKLMNRFSPNCSLVNGDEVREKYNDWDFSIEGRIRQAERIKTLSDDALTQFVICDFIAPTQSIRDSINADFIIWMDTTSICKYQDTNMIFETPDGYDLRIKTHTFSTFVFNTLVRNILLKLEGR
jgi:adenylate kinase family enzyme